MPDRNGDDDELDVGWDLARGLKLQPGVTSAEARHIIADDPLPSDFAASRTRLD